MEKKLNLTKEQQIFFIGMKKIKALQENPEASLMEIQQIQLFLWDKIKLFAKKEMIRMVGNCTTPDERLDIEQDMVMIFLEKLHPLLILSVILGKRFLVTCVTTKCI